MSRARAIFAAITALLEDMHGVAVEGQVPALPPEAGRSLVSALQADARRLERKIADAGARLGR